MLRSPRHRGGDKRLTRPLGANLLLLPRPSGAGSNRNVQAAVLGLLRFDAARLFATPALPRFVVCFLRFRSAPAASMIFLILARCCGSSRTLSDDRSIPIARAIAKPTQRYSPGSLEYKPPFIKFLNCSICSAVTVSTGSGALHGAATSTLSPLGNSTGASLN